jgi:hypothetical protein
MHTLPMTLLIAVGEYFQFAETVLLYFFLLQLILQVAPSSFLTRGRRFSTPFKCPSVQLHHSREMEFPWGTKKNKAMLVHIVLVFHQ